VGCGDSLAFSPDGTHIMSRSYDNTIKVCDVVTGKQVGETLKGLENPLCSVAFLLDGTHIVSRSDDMTIKVQNAVTGQQIGEAMRGSVATAQADVFLKNGYTVPNKIAKILRIFERIEELKNRGVTFWN
jgi:WD40 repeat protein